MSDMDDADKAFMESLTPDGCVATGFIAVATFINADGEDQFRVYNQLDHHLSTCIGYLEFAKLHLVALSDTGLNLAYEDTDE